MQGSTGAKRPKKSRMSVAIALLCTLLGLPAAAEAATLTMSWTAPVTNADGSKLTDLSGYRIYIGTSTPTCPGSSYHAVSSSTSAPSANQTVSATITGLNAGTSYSVRITAIDGSGNQSACSAPVSGVARGVLSVSPGGTVSFGTVAVGSSTDRTFTVRNTSGSSVSGGASVSAPFSIVSGGSFSLAAGASRDVVVRLRPTSTGSFAGNVSFTGGGDTITRGVSGSTSGSPASPPSGTPTLTITRSGSGTVTSSPSGISCGGDCTQGFTSGTRVTLTASPASGARFSGWSGGGCSGTGTCSVTMNGSVGVTATFTTASSGAALPDLVINSVTTPSTLTRNRSYSMSFKVANQGSGTAGSMQARVYISRNNALSSDDVSVWSRSFGSLAVGGASSNTISGTVPSSLPPGSYYVIMVVDSNKQVTESNESNNTVVRAITVR
jgi:CARDB/Divergent InlB B-repeat domain/Fibronectin type III domain